MNIDEQVAAALGWTEIGPSWFDGKPTVGLPPGPRTPGDPKCFDQVPAYSTDWSLLPQLLAWLTRENDVGIDVYIGGRADVSAFTSTDTRDNYIDAEGDTLPLALCRLVLAVRAREEGK